MIEAVVDDLLPSGKRTRFLIGEKEWQYYTTGVPVAGKEERRNNAAGE